VNHQGSVCPYLERRDTRCASSLTLVNLTEAFRLCVGHYEFCSRYNQIRVADEHRQVASPVDQPAQAVAHDFDR